MKVTWEYLGDRHALDTYDPDFNDIPLSVNLLPDAMGLICIEPRYDRHDNCYVVDGYGKCKYRLTVPWRLTGYEVPPGAQMWFRNMGTHREGQFGVTAWIEYAGDFYFELDYHEGKFLWGKKIRF